MRERRQRTGAEPGERDGEGEGSEILTLIGGPLAVLAGDTFLVF